MVILLKDKSIQIHNWIQKRYEHYDKIEGRYCGDKYEKKVFRDASKLFKMTVSEVYEHYNYYTINLLEELAEAKALHDQFEKFKSNPESFNATRLHNKKVKINVDKILNDKARTNSKFQDFVKNNKDKTFTAQTDEKMKVMYNLKEDGIWLFHEDDLEEVK